SFAFAIIVSFRLPERVKENRLLYKNYEKIDREMFNITFRLPDVVKSNINRTFINEKLGK
ncbi:MAG: hypothetical protein IKH45_00770, partial [Neisseriaceae bacterium]|nr:hypothetical protein [Neisseriaceae bacterium]